MVHQPGPLREWLNTIVTVVFVLAIHALILVGVYLLVILGEALYDPSGGPSYVSEVVSGVKASMALIVAVGALAQLTRFLWDVFRRSQVDSYSGF